MCPSCMDLYVIHVFWNYIKILFLVQTISCLSSLSEPISHDFIVSLVLSLASFEDRNSTDWCLLIQHWICKVVYWSPPLVKARFCNMLRHFFSFNCSSLLTSAKDGDLWMPLASTEHGNKVVMHKSPPCHWYDMCFLFPVLENEVLLNFFTGLCSVDRWNPTLISRSQRTPLRI